MIQTMQLVGLFDMLYTEKNYLSFYLLNLIERKGKERR